MRFSRVVVLCSLIAVESVVASIVASIVAAVVAVGSAVVVAGTAVINGSPAVPVVSWIESVLPSWPANTPAKPMVVTALSASEASLAARAGLARRPALPAVGDGLVLPRAADSAASRACASVGAVPCGEVVRS